MKREGYLLVDHSASPGLPEDVARQAGYDPAQTGEGKRFETATLTCAHCHAQVIPNLDRTRERAHCFQCGVKYICDLCDAERRRPDYVHRPMIEIVDLVATGKFTAERLGVRPLLVPTKKGEF